MISLLWLGSIMGAGCAFLTQVLLARELGPSALGVFAASLGMVMLVAPLASFGVGGFWLRMFGQEGWQGRRWLGSSLRYTALTTILVFSALLVWAVVGPHDATTRSILIVLSMHLLGQVAVELVNAKLQLEERYLSLAMWQLLPHLLRLLFVALFAFAMVNLMTLQSIAISYASIAVGMFSLGCVVMWRLYHGQFSLQGHGASLAIQSTEPTTATMKQVAAQSWPFGLAGVFYMIYFQSDIILLKYIKGDEAAGIYNVAFVIMAAIYILPNVIYQKFLMPKIHRWANSDRDMFYQVYRKGNWVMLLLGLVAMLAIWLLTPWGVRVLFGDSYADAVPVLAILALAAPIRFMSNNVGAALVTKDHMKQKVGYMALVAIFNILLNFLLIPSYGIEGAAIATLISEAILLTAYYFYAIKMVFPKIR